jgi:predicted RNA binding protein YcfA (HicA-like mRNA interferase family)
MSKLPVISGEELIKVLKKLGYEVVRQKGSHVRLKAEGKPSLTVPCHKTLKPGLLNKILKEVGLSREEFDFLLKGKKN